MSIFGKNTKKATSTKRAPKKAAAASVAPLSTSQRIAPEAVLLRPRITEKSAQMTAQSVYTFDVSLRATKTDVAQAVRAVYKVVPEKIRMVRTPGKKVRLRTRRGTGSSSETKKAYVYLKEGDRIEFSS